MLVVSGDISTDARRRALALGARDFLDQAVRSDRADAARPQPARDAAALSGRAQAESRAARKPSTAAPQELEDARVEMLERLAMAAEYRDDSTSRHTERVESLSGRLAEALGLDGEEVEV